VKLVIVTPQNKLEYVVQWIEAHTQAGSLVIQPGHAPMILMLSFGFDFSFLLENGEKKVISLTRPGFLEVNRDGAVALLGQEILL
jgi:F0F1-type ATP synthase epsilon subunit